MSQRKTSHRVLIPGRGFLVFLAVSLLAVGGCSSLRKVAIRSVANSLAGGSDVFVSDNDPQLVAEAMPFALKTLESLAAEVPKHRPLLLATCQGYTQYTLAFLENDLPRLELYDYKAYKVRRARAVNLYLRARNYCLRALDLAEPGTSKLVIQDPEAALAPFGPKEIEYLVWTGSSWGMAISLGVDRPELVVDVPVVRAFFDRAFALDPDYLDGGLHEAKMIFETLPEAMGGSLERARYHYGRAIELHGGKRASTYVNWAELVSIPRQDREEFERLLEKALAIDPDAVPEERLANLISQERARMLLDLADDLFL